MTDAPDHEAAFRSGFLAGALWEWRSAAETTRLAVNGQAHEGRWVLMACLSALGLDDLAKGSAPAMGPLDADQAWADHIAGRDPAPLPEVRE